MYSTVKHVGLLQEHCWGGVSPAAVGDSTIGSGMEIPPCCWVISGQLGSTMWTRPRAMRQGVPRGSASVPPFKAGGDARLHVGGTASWRISSSWFLLGAAGVYASTRQLLSNSLSTRTIAARRSGSLLEPPWSAQHQHHCPPVQTTARLATWTSPKRHDLRCERPVCGRVGELRQQRQEEQEHLRVEPTDLGALRRLPQDSIAGSRSGLRDDPGEPACSHPSHARYAAPAAVGNGHRQRRAGQPPAPAATTAVAGAGEEAATARATPSVRQPGRDRVRPVRPVCDHQEEGHGP